MKRSIIILMFLLLSSGILFAQNFEGFETGNFLAYNWQFSGSVNWTTTTNNAYQGAFCAQTGGIGNDQFSRISITLEAIAESDLSFFWKVDSELDADFLIFYLDGDEIAAISGNESWQEHALTIPVGYHTLVWSYEKDAEGSSGADAGWLDSITFPVTTIFDHDLAINSLQGPSTLYQGYSGVFNVLVKNYGANLENDYTINLYREGGILLDQLNVNETLESEEEIVHHLVWVVPPDEPAAVTYVYAEAILAGDENISNDISEDLAVTIYELGLAQITIGHENEVTNWYPFKFHMNASLAETIYRQIQIGYVGNIHAIGYKYNFTESMQNAPVEVFMGMTSQTSFANGWIGSNNLTPVYQGDLDFDNGINTIVIPFDDPFPYTSNNLCIMTHNEFTNETYSIGNEFFETINTNYFDCTIAAGSTSPISTTNPQNGFLFSRFPNLTLFMEITNLGTVEGYVYDELGNPVSTAYLDIVQNSLSTYSNGSGYYQFGNLIEGDYDFIVSKPGYESASASGTVITDQITVIDFTLISLPMVQVYGQITGSVDPDLGLVNAAVDLLGEENYSTQTDNDGNFLIPVVFGNESYELNVTYNGYEPYVAQIDVQTDDLDLGTITLNEVALPAINVVATQNITGDELTLEWSAPNISDRDFESFAIYRFWAIHLNNPSNWIELESAYSDTSLMDAAWNTLPNQTYQYAVIANYTNGITSEAAFSNEIERIGVNIDESVIEPLSKISSIYPNPFNPITNISYQLASDVKVELYVHNVRGQKIATLANNIQQKGFHHISWDGKDEVGREQSSGIYFINLLVNNKQVAVEKCMLMK